MALTQAQVAAILDVTPRRIRQIHQEGKGPPQTVGGQYDEAEFGKWLRAQAASDSGGYNYETERARLTHEQADKTALENAELRGDLARMSVVEQWWSELGAAMRGKLVAIPSRLAALIADVPLRARFTTQAEALMFEALAEIQKDAVPAAIRARIGRARRDDVPVVAASAAETDG